MANEVTFSGKAMDFLQDYADSSFTLAETYLSDLHSFTVTPFTTDIPIISGIEVPESFVVDSSLGIQPESPTGYPTIPSDVSTQTFNYPSKPSYSVPNAPSLSSITLPNFSDGTISPLTTSIPTITFSIPTLSSINDGGQASEDDLVKATKAKLLSNIVSGGTMLNPTVETNIWNRDKERREQSFRDIKDRIVSQWAKLGWSLPDGLLAGQMLAVENEYMNRDIDMSREISIKQAELEQKGMFESLKLGIDLETVLIGSFNDYAKRVFETSKVTVDATIELYKQQVTMYNTQLEAFKADLSRYQASIQIELGRVEIYKAKMAGQELITKIDENRVQIYSAQIEAIEKLAKIFQTEVQTVALQYESEKMKVDIFKTKVEAYVAEVDSITKKYLGAIDGYKAYISAWSASADFQTKYADLKLKSELAKAELTIKQWEIAEKISEEEISLRLEALKTVAVASSNLAAGSLSAIHASVSDSYQKQYSYYNDITSNV